MKASFRLLGRGKDSGWLTGLRNEPRGEQSLMVRGTAWKAVGTRKVFGSLPMLSALDTRVRGSPTGGSPEKHRPCSHGRNGEIRRVFTPELAGSSPAGSAEAH